MNRKDGQGMNSLVLKIIIFVTAVAGVGFVTYGAYTYKTNLENQAKEAATQVVVEVKDDSKTNIESVVNKALEEQEIKVDYMVREIDKQTMYITDNIIGYDGPNEADFKEKINFTENQEVQVIGVVEQYKNESCLWYLLEGRRIQDMKIKKFLELPENKDLACQTADYLGRFPQIISDGNTCHSLRSMRQKHIISGVTADYRGLISVQLWLD